MPAPAFCHPLPLAPAKARNSADTEISEDALVRSLAQADGDAYRILWRRFRPLVSSMIRRRLRDREDTEDLVQEVFIAVFKGAPALRDPLALRAFVLTITSRMLNRQLKKRRRIPELSLASQTQLEDLVGTHADARAKHAALRLGRLMSQLRAREHKAFLLHFVRGLDAAEVAQGLGVSTPTARRSISRARKYVHLWASRDPFLLDYMEAQSA